MKKYLLLLLAILPTIAFSEQTLEQLRRAGAKRLSSEELNSVLVGATASGADRDATYSEVTFHPDGRTSGYLVVSGRNYALTGHYQITDDGHLCLHYDFPNETQPYEACVFFYTKDAQYYFAYSDTAPKTEVYKRIFKK